MATHSSIPPWRILGTEEPGRLQSMELQRVRTTERLTHRHTQVQKHPHYSSGVWEGFQVASVLPAPLVTLLP